jgi:leucyl/phenylalanyl-tRNA--protein transferase
VPVYRLPTEPAFPDPDLAEPDGLLAVGGDLSVERLLLAYSLGIFPWYSEGYPILWWTPDPRLVLEPAAIHISRSLAKTLKRGQYRVRADTAFDQVIARCAAVPRPNQDGTWITSAMQEAYVELHAEGFAHSLETWSGDELVGGLYGVSLGGVFFGESMFADESDASKVALVRLAETMQSWGHELIDCQLDTEHLRRLGARSISRREFMRRLAEASQKPTLRGRWSLPD